MSGRQHQHPRHHHNKSASEIGSFADGHKAAENHSQQHPGTGFAQHGAQDTVAFMQEKSSSSNKNCSCCEKPFDGPLADDLRVVHVRWDNYARRWVPICQSDYEFRRPPLYYRYGGFETMESASSWVAGGIALLVLLGFFLVVPADGSSTWVVGITALALLLMCMCAGGVAWWSRGYENGGSDIEAAAWR